MALAPGRRSGCRSRRRLRRPASLLILLSSPLEGAGVASGTGLDAVESVRSTARSRRSTPAAAEAPGDAAFNAAGLVGLRSGGGTVFGSSFFIFCCSSAFAFGSETPAHPVSRFGCAIFVFTTLGATGCAGFLECHGRATIKRVALHLRQRRRTRRRAQVDIGLALRASDAGSAAWSTRSVDCNPGHNCKRSSCCK